MNTYVTTAFRGHNPVGVAAELLNSELRAQKLVGSLCRHDMRLVSHLAERAVILINGDY